MTADDILRTQRQQLLAETGEAINQCPHCGSYRADEQPPLLHKRDCPNYDSWKEDPLKWLA